MTGPGLARGLGGRASLRASLRTSLRASLCGTKRMSEAFSVAHSHVIRSSHPSRGSQSSDLLRVRLLASGSHSGRLAEPLAPARRMTIFHSTSACDVPCAELARQIG